MCFKQLQFWVCDTEMDQIIFVNFDLICCRKHLRKMHTRQKPKKCAHLQTVAQKFMLLTLHSICSLICTAHIILHTICHNLVNREKYEHWIFNQNYYLRKIYACLCSYITFLARTRSSACSNSVSILASCWTEVTFCRSCSSAKYNLQTQESTPAKRHFYFTCTYTFEQEEQSIIQARTEMHKIRLATTEI